MPNSSWLLRVLLRVTGIVCLLALGAVVMPWAWMGRVHELAGLGTLPDKPIVEYLARSTSMLYAVLGGLFLVLAADIRKFGPVIAYTGLAFLVLGVAVLAIDISAGLPTWWSAGEGASTIGLGLAILVLNARAR